MILNFIKSILHYELYILPIYIIIRIIYLRNKKIDVKREVLLLLFISTIIMLLSQTILCEFHFNKSFYINKGIHSNNFIPFKIFYDSYISHIKYGNYTYFIISLLGNIVLFIPYGFLLPSLYKIKGKYVVLLGFSLSLFIELFQLFLPRWTDIDDIILNTFGTFIGYLLYKYCVKIYHRE